MKNVSTVKTLLQTITMILIISSLFSTSLQAQAKGVVIGEDNLEQSAILELHSDNKGILIPRMSTLSRNAIPGAASGLFLFNTDNGIFNKRLSSGWTELDDD